MRIGLHWRPARRGIDLAAQASMEVREPSSHRAAALDLTASGRRLFDRYVLLERLGGGGGSEVWRTLDEASGEQIALRIVNPPLAHEPALRAALAREHAVAARLDHPGAIRVHPPVYDGERAALPMELAGGGDLRRLRGAGYLEIVPALLEAAQVLDHAHRRGVVHGDLEASRVLFDHAGRVRVAGFRATADVPAEPGHPSHGSAPPVAGPGQARRAVPSATDDIRAFGALAFELLTGIPPEVSGAGPAADEAAPAFRPVHRAPVRLGSLVMRMLAPDARLRPRSMREVIEQLEASFNDTMTLELDELPELEGQAVHEGPRPAREPGAIPAFHPGDSHAQGSLPRVAAPRPEARRGAARPRRRLLAAVSLLAIAAAATGLALYVDPHLPARIETFLADAVTQLPRLPRPAAVSPMSRDADRGAALRARLLATRAEFEGRLAALAERTDSPEMHERLAAARARAAESVGAYDAGSLSLAMERLQEALRLLDAAETAPPPEPAPVAVTAAPSTQAAEAEPPGTERSGEPDVNDAGLEPAATSARETAGRAAERPATRGGRQARIIEDYYTNALDAGLEALAAGRLEEAQIAFELAQTFRPDGIEPAQGLERVRAARDAQRIARARERASTLELQGRWSEAAREYEGALAIDPTLEFARAGRARVASRLEALRDDPGSLTLLGSHRLPDVEEFYPEAAKRLGEEGTVGIRVCADASGRIRGAPVVAESSGHPRLDAAALELVRAGQLAVATRGGLPVAACHRLQIAFTPPD